LQFFPVKKGQFPQDPFAFRRQMEKNLAAILIAVPSGDGAACNQAIRQFDGAVVAKREPGRERADSGARAFRQPFDCKQKLVLLRLDSIRPGGFFAEVKEAADFIAELRYLAVFAGGKNFFRRLCHGHICIVSRHNQRGSAAAVEKALAETLPAALIT
jgi:hypothetical protein